MSAADQKHWDDRFSQTAAEPRVVNVMTDNQHLLPSEGVALDLACGLGGNALWLAERGLTVEGWDISPVALSKLAAQAEQRSVKVKTRQIDLQETALPKAAFDLIVVSAYLCRPLCPAITQALRPGGLLAYQTYTQFKPVAGLHGPKNPDYLLARNELLELFSMLDPVVYRDERDLGDLEQGLRNQAYLIARRER